MENLLDSHTHTIASGHAYNTIYEMARSAADKKLSLLAITDHSMQMPGSSHEFYFINFKVLPRVLYGVEMMYGAEVNIMDYDGGLDMRQELLEKMDVVVASLHTPCLNPGTREENTRALLKVMENPLVNIIGHPDDGRYPVDYDTLAAAAKEHHVLLELNNSSLNPLGSRKNAWENDRCLLKYCEKYGTPVILDSDAHCEVDVGNHKLSDQLLAELNFPDELIVNHSLEVYKSYTNRFRKNFFTSSK